MTKEATVKTKPAETAPNPAQLARAEVVRLNDAERERSKLFGVKAIELSTKRAQRGDAGLKATDPEAARRESSRAIVVMAEELDALRDEVAAARRQRLEAIPKVFVALGDEAERAAAQLEADAANLEAESNRLRRALEVFDDSTYAPTPPTPPERFIGNQQGGAPVIVHVRVPRFELVRLAAREKRNEAMQARRKEPHKAGSVSASTLEQLVDVVFSDPMRVGPSVDAITTWFDDAVVKERKRRQRIDHGADFVPVAAAINNLHLEWRNGTIDVSASSVSSASPSAPDVQAHGPGNVLFKSSTDSTMQAIDRDADYQRAVATEQSA